MSPPPMGGQSGRSMTLMTILTSRSSIYSYLSVTPNGDVHLDRPKDDRVIDELFNDLMVSHRYTMLMVEQARLQEPTSACDKPNAFLPSSQEVDLNSI